MRITSEDSEHIAILDTETRAVRVYQRAKPPSACLLGALLGVGRFEAGIIRDSGVNCGILVRLEPSLREQTKTH